MSSEYDDQVKNVTEWANAFISIGRCSQASFEKAHDTLILEVENSLLKLLWTRSPDVVKTLAHLAGSFNCIPRERKSKYLYEAALELEDSLSQYLLAWELSWDGIDPPDDRLQNFHKDSHSLEEWSQAESKHWMEIAAYNGSLDAQLKIGLTLIRSDDVSDYVKATNWLQQVVLNTKQENQKGIELHDLAEAKYILAYQMELGRIPSLPLRELFLLYEGAANAGVPEAMLAVGHYLENGIGVNENIKEAIDWYLKAAGEDYGLHVGILLAWRLSDLSKHRKLAAEHGYVEAMLSLGEDKLAKCGNDYSYFHSGVLLLQNCLEKGSLKAAHILAKTFDQSGEYRIPDEWNLYFGERDRLESALEYFKRAHELGLESALVNIKRIQAQLDRKLED
jgi:TPR repeat protein